MHRALDWPRHFGNGTLGLMRYYVSIRDATFEVEIEEGGVRVDGEPVEISALQVAGTDVHSFLIDGESHRIVARSSGKGKWDLHLGGRHERVEVWDERTKTIREMLAALAGPVGPQAVRAPMPGLVVKVEVEEGELVEAGTGLLIVEAMKMENELSAEARARVGAIHVAPGQAVEKDQILMEMLPPEMGDSEETP